MQICICGHTKEEHERICDDVTCPCTKFESMKETKEDILYNQIKDNAEMMNNGLPAFVVETWEDRFDKLGNPHFIDGPNGKCKCGKDYGHCGNKLKAFILSELDRAMYEGREEERDIMKSMIDFRIGLDKDLRNRAEKYGKS